MLHFPVLFPSDGNLLAGVFSRNVSSLTEQQPTVIVTGSWLAVKEHMPAVYAQKLVDLGYTTFIFDFAGFGESPGSPHQTEIPAHKISNLLDAANFVSTMSFVRQDAVAYLAICASAQYALAARARGAKVQSFASLAGWYHDAASVAPFYGGEGVWRNGSRKEKLLYTTSRNREM